MVQCIGLWRYLAKDKYYEYHAPYGYTHALIAKNPDGYRGKAGAGSYIYQGIPDEDGYQEVSGVSE